MTACERILRRRTRDDGRAGVATPWSPWTRGPEDPGLGFKGPSFLPKTFIFVTIRDVSVQPQHDGIYPLRAEGPEPSGIVGFFPALTHRCGGASRT